MTRAMFLLLDAVLTAAVVAGAVLLRGRWQAQPLGVSGGQLFYAGTLFLLVALVVPLFRFRGPPGILGAATGRPEPEKYSGRGRETWFDRCLTLDNTWLLVGLMLTAISLLPAFLSSPPAEGE